MTNSDGNVLNICQVHDTDDVVPDRICGRYLPCKDHPAETMPHLNLAETKRNLQKAIETFRDGMMRCVDACETPKEVLLVTFVMLQVERCLDRCAKGLPKVEK